jgi:hypothetical protein
MASFAYHSTTSARQDKLHFLSFTLLRIHRFVVFPFKNLFEIFGENIKSTFERVWGIEPQLKDWKSLVLPLNYTREFYEWVQGFCKSKVLTSTNTIS